MSVGSLNQGRLDVFWVIEAEGDRMSHRLRLDVCCVVMTKIAGPTTS